MPINPKLNKPMMKRRKGDGNWYAKKRMEHTFGALEGKARDNYDEINWRSKQNLPRLSGKIRNTTHAKAGLPVWGNP
jgi:hypothetical protein